MDFSQVSMVDILLCLCALKHTTFTVTDGNENCCKSVDKFCFPIYLSRNLKIFLRIYPKKNETQKIISTQRCSLEWAHYDLFS